MNSLSISLCIPEQKGRLKNPLSYEVFKIGQCLILGSLGESLPEGRSISQVSLPLKESFQ